MSLRRRHGSSNGTAIAAVGSIVVVLLLGLFLFRNSLFSVGGSSGEGKKELLVYCAAGMRYPMEQIVKDYKREFGVSVQLQYGGSNTLLSQLEVSKTGDLYLAGDDSYIKLGQEKDLVNESIPLARMRPVIAIKKDNDKIKSVDDLLSKDVRVALGNPDAAAVGKKTRKLLTASGHWKELEKRVIDDGVFKPTVNEVANDIKIGAVDAGIIWDSTVVQYDDLKAIRTTELDAGEASITIGILQSSKDPTAALKFARYVGARDKGLKIFKEKGFEVVDGDLWSAKPQMTFFAGAVNRRALEPIIKEFEKREGVEISTKFNGCGILTGEMKVLNKNHASGFPDMFMACDVYYLETVKEMFQDAHKISDTDIVIVVQKGNPKNIRSLSDLVKPGVRVVLGQPQQCTVGVLSRKLLESEGLYKKLVENNLASETTSSAFLIPSITTRSADAVLAYVTDTRAESDKLEVIKIESPLAKAVQPYSISRNSDFKYLARRLHKKIVNSRGKFEAAGFNFDPFRLDDRAPTDSLSRAVKSANSGSPDKPEQK